ncbi:flavodoxin [Flavobacterium sp. KJJ]|uniref:flavodoxin n=1 Tax=Flavobacterium sp. KJJ TaxID=1270193 RepID=UPI000A914127|nr:flavodoxin [Flavobacterium sp. KJJ]
MNSKSVLNVTSSGSINHGAIKHVPAGTINTWVLVMLIFFSSLSSIAQKSSKALQKPKKVLIVYLSRTGNTKIVAEIIQNTVGGDIVAIELQKPYSKDYKENVDQVSKENERGYLPPLKTKIQNIEKYDFVFVGFPTWGMQLPPPIKSFLKQYNLDGKTIIPFNTNAGYGIGSSF